LNALKLFEQKNFNKSHLN